MTGPTRPVLRYHGGKWRLAPWIIRHFPAHRVYVEPFGGGGSVLLRKPRSYVEVYNDLDDELGNLFRVLRDRRTCDELCRAVALTPYGRREYFAAVEAQPTEPVERARALLVRTFLTWNAKHRDIPWFAGVVKPAGKRHPAAQWAELSGTLAAAHERLLGVIVENRDAIKVITSNDSADTLIYADPPYPHGTRAQFWSDSAYRHEMADDDHRKLAATLRAAAGRVVLSGYPCDLYDVELYPDWHRVTKDAHADGRHDRTEVLWLNPACAAALKEAA